jgi:uncharacterized membrane protein YidH (DUF202 family)
MSSRPHTASERNDLAWNRTALSSFAFTVLVFKLALVHHRPAEFVATAAACVQTALFMVVMRRRRPHAVVAPPALLLAATVATAVTTALVAVGLFTSQ